MLLDDVPDIFNSVAEFTTRHASAQAVITNTDSVVLESVGEVIVSFSHGTNKNANALFWSYVLNIIFDTNDRLVVAEGHLAAIRGQMVSDRVLDDLE